jgi:hypothetical protein
MTSLNASVTTMTSDMVAAINALHASVNTMAVTMARIAEVNSVQLAVQYRAASFAELREHVNEGPAAETFYGSLHEDDIVSVDYRQCMPFIQPYIRE